MFNEFSKAGYAYVLPNGQQVQSQRLESVGTPKDSQKTSQKNSMMHASGKWGVASLSQNLEAPDFIKIQAQQARHGLKTNQSETDSIVQSNALSLTQNSKKNMPHFKLDLSKCVNEDDDDEQPFMPAKHKVSEDEPIDLDKILVENVAQVMPSSRRHKPAPVKKPPKMPKKTFKQIEEYQKRKTETEMQRRSANKWLSSVLISQQNAQSLVIGVSNPRRLFPKPACINCAEL